MSGLAQGMGNIIVNKIQKLPALVTFTFWKHRGVEEYWHAPSVRALGLPRNEIHFRRLLRD